MGRLVRAALRRRTARPFTGVRGPYAGSKAVRAWLATNADLERNVNASRTHTVDRLAHETRRFLRRRRRRRHIVRGYFQARHVRYAAISATGHIRLDTAAAVQV